MKSDKELLIEAMAALEPFAERWRLHTSYTENGKTPPPNAKNTAITPGALRRAAEVFYGETATNLDVIDRLLDGKWNQLLGGK